MSKINFKKARILILGDVMLDRYYYGSVDRISPEAPVPVVKVVDTSETLGGAANVANNAARLGAEVRLIGFAGNDAEGKTIARLAKRLHVRTQLIDAGLPSTTKSRIVGANQQMLRLDFEDTQQASAKIIRAMKSSIKLSLKECDILAISDYDKGVCSEEICSFAISHAATRKIPVIVDPKTENWTKYKQADFIMPNFKEFCQALGKTVDNEDDSLAVHARILIKKYGIKHVLITRSEKGMSLITSRHAAHIHSQAREVFDVSGAGDTVVAVLSTALAAGYDIKEALQLANVAAGIVVGKAGTVPIVLKELQSKLNDA